MASSKSQSQSNQTTNQADNRIAASDNAIAVGAGATLVQNDVSAPIAIAAIDSGVKNVGQSLDFAAHAVDSSQSIAEKSLEASTDTVRTNAELASTLATVAITNLEKNKRDPNDDTLQTLASTAGKYGAIIAVSVAGLVAWAIFRKSR